MRVIGAIICICSVFCCKSPDKNVSENVFEVDINNAQSTSFTSLFDSVAYIPLESVVGNEISQIDRILYHGDKYIIVDRRIRCIFIFASDGTYLSKIDAIGNGPGEYVQVTDIAIDKFANTLKVLDSAQGKIITFDLEGKMIEDTKIRVTPFPMHFCQINKEFYAFDFQRSNTNPENQYSLFINSIDLSTNLNKYIPYSVSTDISFTPRVTLQQLNDELIYVPVYSPTIYTLKGTTLLPRYSFDFKGKWVDNKFVETKWNDAVEFMNTLRNADFICFFNLLESESHVYAEFKYLKDKYRLIVSKSDNQLTLMRDDDPYNCYYSEIPMCNIKNRFIIPLSPIEYNSIIENKNATISEDNNPVLACVKFK